MNGNHFKVQSKATIKHYIIKTPNFCSAHRLPVCSSTLMCEIPADTAIEVNINLGKCIYLVLRINKKQRSEQTFT